MNDDLPLSQICKITAKSYKCINKCDFRENVPIFLEPNTAAYRDFSQVELFELFFDENLIDMIIEKSNLSTLQKHVHATDKNKAELKVFLSLLIISGYLPVFNQTLLEKYGGFTKRSRL